MKTNWLNVLALALLIGCAPTPTATPPLAPTASATLPATPTITRTNTPTLTATSVPSPTPTPTSTPTRVPSRTPTEPASKRYSSAFGIDYGQPEKYLAQGEQTRLSNPAIINALRGKAPSLAHLGEIYFWIKREFTTWTAGGATIGVATTDQLLTERRLGGCHDWGLVYASIARELGYPTVMIDAAGIAWAKRFRNGEKSGYAGHVFVEVFVGGKWVLIDSTNNWYVETSYDPVNAIVPLNMGNEKEGMFVMRKGVDTRGYGIRSNNELTRLMEDSARTLKIESLVYPPYNFLRFK